MSLTKSMMLVLLLRCGFAVATGPTSSTPTTSVNTCYSIDDIAVPLENHVFHGGPPIRILYTDGKYSWCSVVEIGICEAMILDPAGTCGLSSFAKFAHCLLNRVCAAHDYLRMPYEKLGVASKQAAYQGRTVSGGSGSDSARAAGGSSIDVMHKIFISI